MAVYYGRRRKEAAMRSLTRWMIARRYTLLLAVLLVASLWMLLGCSTTMKGGENRATERRVNADPASGITIEIDPAPVPVKGAKP